MTQETLNALRECHADEIELDFITEEDWDNHAIAQLEELNRDRFAAQPESGVSVCRW